MSYDFGRFVWFELIAESHEQVHGFYGEVLGWSVNTMEMGGGTSYSMATLGQAPVGGFTKPPAPDVPPHWTRYVSVEDVDATAKKVVAAGGRSLMDAFDIPTIGRIQPVVDPQGAAFFLYKGVEGDAPATSGHGSVHWNELMTSDAQAAVKFYESVLGYKAEAMEMPDGTYYVLKQGETSRGGLMQRPDDNIPPHWGIYFEVDDCDASIAQIEKLGGKSLDKAMDVPGVGRFAHVTDPVGAAFGVITPAKS